MSIYIRILIILLNIILHLQKLPTINAPLQEEEED